MIELHPGVPDDYVGSWPVHSVQGPDINEAAVDAVLALLDEPMAVDHG